MFSFVTTTVTRIRLNLTNAHPRALQDITRCDILQVGLLYTLGIILWYFSFLQEKTGKKAVFPSFPTILAIGNPTMEAAPITGAIILEHLWSLKERRKLSLFLGHFAFWLSGYVIRITEK